MEVEFAFHEPATEQEIQSFTDRTGIQLPEDYQAFLRMHNGAVLLKPWFGGEMELFHLAEVENKRGIVGYFLDHWYPIAGQNGHFLMIDGEKANRGEKDYLMWWDSSIVDDAKHLNLNFEIWIDRFIVSQGSMFWYWPLYNVHHYYRNR